MCPLCGLPMLSEPHKMRTETLAIVCCDQCAQSIQEADYEDALEWKRRTGEWPPE
jgi:ribosome-binding protein aMBF1 (putative translation factor)